MNRSTKTVLLAATMLCACAGDPPPRIDDELGIEVPNDWSANGTDKTNDDPAQELRVDWWRDFGDDRAQPSV